MTDALPRIFISYARADSLNFVDRLEQDLKAQQFQPWVDRHGLEGGMEWMRMIQGAIEECQAVVVVLSPAAVESKFVHMEYRYADDLGKLVIPLTYLPVKTPIDLRILQWVDFQAGYEEGLRQLMQALSRLKMSTPSHQAANLAPPAPQLQPLQLPALPPKTKEQWFTEGSKLHKEKRYAEALAAYEQAIKLDQQFFLAHCGRGVELAYLNRLEEALAAYDQAITLNRNNPLPYNGKAGVLGHLNRFHDSLMTFDQAIQLDPQNASSYYGKAQTLKEMGRYKEAEQALQKARELGHKS